MLHKLQQIRARKDETGFITINFFHIIFLLFIVGIILDWQFKFTQKMQDAYQTMRQEEAELLQQRHLLLSQLPVGTQGIVCSPVPSHHSLKCKLSKEGLLRLHFEYLEVLVPADVSLSSVTFIVGGPDNFTLEFGANLTKEQRRALLRTIKTKPTPLKS